MCVYIIKLYIHIVNHTCLYKSLYLSLYVYLICNVCVCVFQYHPVPLKYVSLPVIFFSVVKGLYYVTILCIFI